MYKYSEIKHELFTEDNQKLFLGIRDQVQKMIKLSGAVKMNNAIRLPSGISAADSWEMMACVDRLVELGELEEVIPEKTLSGAGQDRVFVKGSKFNV